MPDVAGGENLKLLVVDDEPIVHQMIDRIVESSDLPVTVAGRASSGEDAMRLCAEVCPDICILDILMGEMTGLELAARLADEAATCPVFIILTAYRSFEYAQQAIRVGAVDYIVKPIQREAVVGALKKAVARIEAERLDGLEKEKLRSYLHEMMPEIVPGGGPADEARRTALTRAVREFVEKHHAEKIGLRAVAEYLNLSPGYLGHLFKMEHKVSFKAYLRRVRIARAKELMRDPKVNISQVARMVGYDDISYFSQSFLEETGVRPSEYRGEGRRWPR